MHGANDFSRGPAMTREQALKCLQVGIDMAREEKKKGLDIVAAGEMGIGNTTPLPPSWPCSQAPLWKP